MNLKLKQMNIGINSQGRIYARHFHAIKFLTLRFLRVLLRLFYPKKRYMKVDALLLEKINRLLVNADKIFIKMDAAPFYMVHNGRYAACLMMWMDNYYDCEFMIKEFDRIDDLRYHYNNKHNYHNEQIPLSINELMLLNFNKTETEILAEDWRYNPASS